MIFVFGSNLEGRHGAGAALHAAQYYGAEYGVGRGLTGRAYALPTKRTPYETLLEREVRDNIVEFLDFARNHSDKMFVLTPIGLGRAGFSKHTVVSALRRGGVPQNVVLHTSWLEHAV